MGKDLYERLKEYGQSDYYPLHMPGHKRVGIVKGLPFDLDITEIDGFDNLHDATGLIKEAQERAARLFGAKETFFLVNGSSSGVLSAISACTNYGDRILMARNCHRSAYNGAMLNGLNLDYISPKALKTLGISLSIDPEDIERKLDENTNIKTVFITSPTYEGVISDIKSIADIVHDRGGILIVDEAHGPHLRFLESFPASAIKEGADIVIQSAHKTLPALTQSAFLHVNSDRVDIGRLKMYLSTYQSSSPSYILMASLDACVSFLEEEGDRVFADYSNLIMKVREELKELKCLKLFDKDGIDAYIYDYDPGKIVISCAGTSYSGVELSSLLRDKYHIECEMSGVSYIIAMTSIMDSYEGLNRLVKALKEIDQTAEIVDADEWSDNNFTQEPLVRMKISQAVDAKLKEIDLSEAEEKISGEYIYVYPPGTPLVTPGEEISRDIIKKLEYYKSLGLEICGAAGLKQNRIKVVI